MRLILLVFLGGCGLTLELAPPPGEEGGDAGLADAPADVTPDAPGCMVVEDCEGLPRTAPDSSCGAYRCEGGFCLENDLDGDGVGPGCESPDCDDLDPSVTLEAIVACGGRPGICGESAYAVCTGGVPGDCEGLEDPSVEVCNDVDDDCDGMADEGLELDVGTTCARPYRCVDGAWTAPPMTVGVEMCGNGIDDDCNGLIDDGCPPPRCVYVTNDLDVTGTPDDPRGGVANIRMALSLVTTDPSLDTICLLANPSGSTGCTPKTHVSRDPIPGGVTIVGNLRRQSVAAEAIPCSAPGMTRIGAPDGDDATLEIANGGPVTLRDLTVLYPNLDGNVDAIRVQDGAQLSVENVSISGGIAGGVAPSQSRGIRAGPGSTITVVQSDIEAPGDSSWGIEAVDATVRLHDACGAASCDCTGTSIRGGGNNGAVVSISGGALAIDNYPLCGSGYSALEANGTDVVVAGSVLRTDTDDDAEVVAIDCDSGNTVLLHANAVRIGTANGDATGVRLGGACNPILSANRVWALSQIGDVRSTVGVLCGQDARCILSNNEIYGIRAAGLSAEFAAGVTCEDDGCALLAGNFILASEQPDTEQAIGIEISGNRGMVLERNRISGGCAASGVVGIDSLNSTLLARSNLILGTECRNDASFSSSGVEIDGGDVILNGNTIEAGGTNVRDGDCFGIGAYLKDVDMVVLNNIFGAGIDCSERTAFEVEGTRPVILSHNGFTQAGIYVSIRGTTYRDPGVLDAMFGFQNNLMEPMPGFQSYPTAFDLTGVSPFLGMGSAGAPADFYGNARPVPASMGAFEIASSP